MEYPPAPPGFEHLDMSDPKQALVWALGSMPSHQPNGQPVPIPPKIQPSWSEFLTALGLVYDPSRQTMFPVVDQESAPMGWLAPVTFVSREEYDKHEAKRAGKTADMEATLQRLNPGLAQQIADMTDPEKRDAMASQAAAIGDILAHIQAQHGGGKNG